MIFYSCCTFFQSILLMPEMEPHPWLVFNDKYALVLNRCTFRWDKEGGSKSGDDSGKKSKKGDNIHISLIRQEDTNYDLFETCLTDKS